MMKERHLLYVIIFVLLISTPVTEAQLFTPSHSFQAKVPLQTMSIGSGQTHLSGKFTGLNVSKMIDIPFTTIPDELMNQTGLDEIIDFSMLNDLHGFPFFSKSTFSNIESLRIINKSAFDNKFQTPAEIQQFLNQIIEFQQVEVVIEQGMTLFGTDGSPIEVQSLFDYALTSFFQMPFASNQTMDVVGILSLSDQKIMYEKNTSILIPFSESTKISVINEQGHTVWSDQGMDNVYLFSHSVLCVTDQSPLHLFPLSTQNNSSDISISITPADNAELNIDQLLSSLSQLSLIQEEMNLPMNVSNDSMMTEIFESVQPVINGGVMLTNGTDSFLVNGDSHLFSMIAFIRADIVSILYEQTNPSVKTVNGQAILMFIDDHFYTEPGKDNQYGLYIPILPIVLWIAAVICFLLWKYYLPKKDNPTLDKKISYVLLSIRIISIVFIFILVDFEVSHQLGVSLFSLLGSQTISLVVPILLVFQLLLWVFGYLSCAFPLQYILISVFKFTPLHKYGRSPAKSIGLISIWLFAALYIVLILNVLLYFVRPLLPAVPVG